MVMLQLFQAAARLNAAPVTTQSVPNSKPGDISLPLSDAVLPGQMIKGFFNGPIDVCILDPKEQRLVQTALVFPPFALPI